MDEGLERSDSNWVEPYPVVVRLGVTNLRVDDETPYSLEVSWEVLDSDVEQYKVTYVSTNRAEETVSKCNHSELAC